MLGGLMVQLTDRLVGRAGELEVLDRAVADLADGRGSAISVVGAPGIGKSRLIAELADRADANGHLVLSGSASELERDLPFGLFVDAIDEYVETVEPRRLERLEADVRTELARVFPSLESFRADGGEAPQNERYRAQERKSTSL